MSSMSTHHIHLAFEDIPVANFEVQKSMEGMGVRAQQDTVKFFSEGSTIFRTPLYHKIFRVEKTFDISSVRYTIESSNFELHSNEQRQRLVSSSQVS